MFNKSDNWDTEITHVIHLKSNPKSRGELFTDEKFVYDMAPGRRHPPSLNSPEPEPLQRMVQGCCVLLSQVPTGSKREE